MGRPATVRVDIVADARGVGPGVKDAEGKLGRLTKIGATVGKGLALGLAGAGLAATAFAASSVRAASDVEQSFGAVDSVFGRSAKTVQQWAGQAATSVGLAKSEYATLASVVGSQLQNMGRDQAASAKDTRKLIGVGADLAATFGGSVNDAVGAVSSLLRGERDPIERYGVAIKQADINARLHAQGLDKLTGASLATAQANATLDLLFQQTRNSAGAFGRESSTLAGQQERLHAQFENVKATIGAGLTPALTTLATWVNTKVLPGAQRLGDTLGRNLGPALSRVGVFIRDQVIPAGRSFFDWYVTKIGPGIQRTLHPIVKAVGATFRDVSGVLRDHKEQLAAVGNTIKVVAEFIGTKVMPILGKVASIGFRIWGTEIKFVLELLFKLIDVIRSTVERVRELSSAVANSKLGKLVGGIGKLIPGGAGGVFTHAPAIYAVGATAVPPSAGRIATAAGDTEITFQAANRAGRGVVIIDRREFPTIVNIRDAFDPVAVANRLSDILDEHAVRMGRVTALGAAL